MNCVYCTKVGIVSLIGQKGHSSFHVDVNLKLWVVLFDQSSLQFPYFRNRGFHEVFFEQKFSSHGKIRSIFGPLLSTQSSKFGIRNWEFGIREAIWWKPLFGIRDWEFRIREAICWWTPPNDVLMIEDSMPKVLPLVLVLLTK